MRVVRTAWHDWYVDDSGESAVFVATGVIAMSELATTLLELVGDADEGRGLEAIAVGLAEVYGAPEGDVVETTSARIAELVDVGVLRLVDIESVS